MATPPAPTGADGPPPLLAPPPTRASHRRRPLRPRRSPLPPPSLLPLRSRSATCTSPRPPRLPHWTLSPLTPPRGTNGVAMRSSTSARPSWCPVHTQCSILLRDRSGATPGPTAASAHAPPPSRRRRRRLPTPPPPGSASADAAQRKKEIPSWLPPLPVTLAGQSPPPSPTSRHSSTQPFHAAPIPDSLPTRARSPAIRCAARIVALPPSPLGYLRSPVAPGRCADLPLLTPAPAADCSISSTCIC
ncbi:hypothetical protein ZWY2020_022232 [Hordeum vulgare]|nr:hypothetical protein ZWY2020_022232 [Hordeum vulgare]